MFSELDESVNPWRGSYYELCIELDARSDSALLNTALKVLVGSPYFEGFWNETTQILKEEPSCVFGHDLATAVGYGLLHVQSDIQLGVVVHVLDIEDEAKRLSVCIPTAMLGEVYVVNYPLHHSYNTWRSAVDDRLSSVADYIFQHVKFDVALLGEEVPDACSVVKEMSTENDFGIALLPAESPLLQISHRCNVYRQPSGLVRVFGKYLEL